MSLHVVTFGGSSFRKLEDYQQLTNRGLIAVVRDSGEVDRILAERSSVRAVAGQYHAQICNQSLPLPDPLAAGVLAMSAAACDGPWEPDLLPRVMRNED
jgi:hypothetical protein